MHCSLWRSLLASRQRCRRWLGTCLAVPSPGWRRLPSKGSAARYGLGHVLGLPGAHRSACCRRSGPPGLLEPAAERLACGEGSAAAAAASSLQLGWRWEQAALMSKQSEWGLAGAVSSGCPDGAWQGYPLTHLFLPGRCVQRGGRRAAARRPTITPRPPATLCPARGLLASAWNPPSSEDEEPVVWGRCCVTDAAV